MSDTIIFAIGSFVFALTVFGSVMTGGVLLTRRFYEENDAYVDRPGYEQAGAGKPVADDEAGPGAGA